MKVERCRSRLLALSLVAIAQLACAPAARAERIKAEPPRSIETVGRASVSVAADRVRLAVAVESRGATAASAASSNAKTAQAIIDAVRARVGAGGKVETAQYTVDAEYEYSKADNRRRLIGYVARNAVTMTSERLDAAGELIDAALGAGANSVTSLVFYRHDDSDVRRQALLEAGRRARETAAAIAESLGVELGDLLSASSEPGPPIGPMPVRARAVAYAESAMDAATPIAAGEVEVEMAVRVVFEVR
jgi:uncharacterized protein YggE